MPLFKKQKQKPIHQRMLTERFIRYMVVQNRHGKKFSKPQEKILRKGMCLGLSIVQAYMEATNHSEWWEALKREIVKWDGEKKSLQLEVTLPGARPVENAHEKTLAFHFERAISYTYLHQAKQNLIESVHDDEKVSNGNFIGLTQKDILLPDGFFDSENGKIQFKDSISGNFTAKQLNAVLDPDIFSAKNTIYLLSHAFIEHSDGTKSSHSCAIRYDSKRKEWRYYDSNNTLGVEKFSDITKLYAGIKARYKESPLRIQIGNFEQNKKIREKVKRKWDANKKAFLNSLTSPKDIISLVKNFGLALISIDTPECIDKFIQLAEKNSALRDALLEEYFLYKNTDWEIVGKYLPTMRKWISKYCNNGYRITLVELSPLLMKETRILHTSNHSKLQHLTGFFPIIFSIDYRNSTNKFHIKVCQHDTKSTQPYSKLEDVIPREFPFYQSEKAHVKIAVKKVMIDMLHTAQHGSRENYRENIETVFHNLSITYLNSQNELDSCQNAQQAAKILTKKYLEVSHSAQESEKLESVENPKRFNTLGHNLIINKSANFIKNAQVNIMEYFVKSIKTHCEKQVTEIDTLKPTLPASIEQIFLCRKEYAMQRKEAEKILVDFKKNTEKTPQDLANFSKRISSLSERVEKNNQLLLNCLMPSNSEIAKSICNRAKDYVRNNNLLISTLVCGTLATALLVAPASTLALPLFAKVITGITVLTSLYGFLLKVHEVVIDKDPFIYKTDSIHQSGSMLQQVRGKFQFLSENIGEFNENKRKIQSYQPNPYTF